MIVSMFCPSCSVTKYDEPKEGEAYFDAKARLRADLRDNCPRARDATAGRCPMRDRNGPQVPSLADFETIR